MGYETNSFWERIKAFIRGQDNDYLELDKKETTSEVFTQPGSGEEVLVETETETHDQNDPKVETKITKPKQTKKRKVTKKTTKKRRK